MSKFESTLDMRTVNNTMRHQYRTLTDKEKEYMENFKDLGMAFLLMLHRAGGCTLDPSEITPDVHLPSRELSLAQTKIEEAVMWAVKHITR